ncbi:lipopolysaccharide assembly protein LapB [Kordiimonas sp. SCSIO 12610]|uniref:tetratricopeptide repeat protein n=1 Tax=Kordiimonas sp. SCSIO 12610 TaxID=2829597 RepID=UPI00210AD96E|nr:tetratricopeptide repeat protein [Kordiimonas sp. SCSIO 12610]UTW56242.1 hypothetical protein KFF44_04905 [Kordiimonas sp. SCSIO 12610]
MAKTALIIVLATMVSVPVYAEAAFDDSATGISENTTENTAINNGASAVQDTIQPLPTDEQPIEEFIIEGDRLLERLRGTLHDGMKAFNDGNYALAEQKFNVLAVKQHRDVRRRTGVENILTFNQGRNFSFAPDKFDEDDTYTSAPRAKARAFAQPIPLARLSRAASQLFFVKGVAQLRQDKNDEAIQSFKRALKINKYNLDARIEYALTSMKTGDLETAGKHITALDKIAAKHCSEDKCAFEPDSKKRFTQVRLAYENLKASKS